MKCSLVQMFSPVAWFAVGFAVLLSGGGCSSPRDTSQSGERWEAIYLKDTKIGYQHTVIEHPEADDQDLLRIRSTMSLTFFRFGQATPMTIEVESLEKSGSLIKFHSLQEDGSGSLVTSGEVRAGKLNLEMSRAGKTTHSAIPWDEKWGGLFAVDSSLMTEPMKPGETRRMRVLMPILFRSADVLLEAKDLETTKLLDSSEELLKIHVTFTIDGRKLEEIRWVDADGKLQKSRSPQTQQTSYRTTKSIAMKPSQGQPIDVAALSSVTVERNLDRPHDTTRIVYRASVDSGDLKDVFATGASQSVQLADNGKSAEIVVTAISPKKPTDWEGDEERPASEHVEPNSMIQSDDETIRRISKLVAVGEQDPWPVALALEQFVNSYITEANFTQAFDTAAEVAANRTGDCTEHAVLLAALCRARQLPSRVAIGLVYLPAGRKGIYAYHMWTEVWIGDRWIPLDATLARGGIGAAHIKLTTSSLAGASPQSVFLPVAQIVGRLKLELVAVDY